MNRLQWWKLSMVAALLGAIPALAQVGAPAAPGAAAPANGAAAAAAGAGAVQPGFFKKACLAIQECKEKFCKTPAGQMLNSMTAPVSALTGGIIPPFCSGTPTAADLLKAGVDGAAANAKKDALEAKERIKAVRYLGTLDCRYYPEAEVALIAALRTDRVECVRFEAALALSRGCCCTKKVIEALDFSVSGSEKDGNPSERSERVRMAALNGLNHCLACYRETPQEVEAKEPEKEKEKEKEKTKDGDKKKDGDGTLPKPKPVKTERDVLDRARLTAAQYQARGIPSLPQVMPAQQTVLPKGQRSLYHIIRFGTDGPSQPAERPQLAMQPAARPTPVAAGPILPPQASPMPRELPQVINTPQMKTMPVETPVSSNRILPPEQPIAQPEKNVTPAASNDPPVQPLPTPETANIQQVPQPMPAPQPEAAAAMIAKPNVSDEGLSGLIDASLTGSTPTERHQAIRGLASHDWRKYPQIVACLVKTARLDSDRGVRVNAIRHLVALKIDVPYVFDHLKYMQKDQDEWIRQESTVALDKLAR